MKNLNFLNKASYALNIINSMIDLLIVINPDATIMIVNQITEKILGYKSVELIGKPVGLIIADEDLRFFKMIRDLIKKEVIYNYKMSFYTKDRNIIPVVFCGSILKNDDGEIEGIVGVARDMRETSRLISELEISNSNLEKRVKDKTKDLMKAKKKIEDAYIKLKSTQAKLLHNEKMSSIGQLAAGVAHELNNPIGFVNSNLGTLGDYVDDLIKLFDKYEALNKFFVSTPIKKVQPLLDNIEKVKKEIDISFIVDDLYKLIEESKDGTKRVKKIVCDLKDFSHVAEEELTYSNINTGIESTLNIVWNELKYKAIVTKELADIPSIKCYPMELNQVFMNILINASQAIKDKGEIHIKTCQKDGFITINIRDTGTGIDKKNLSHIFDPFFTTKEVGKGTGLGLSIAYGIIKKHKGTIEAKSEVGKGTTFHISLPIA